MIAEIRGTIANEPKPNTMQAKACIPIPVNIEGDDSRAYSAAVERGMARKVIPKAFTKHAATSPPVSATTPTTMIIRAAARGC